jgi:Flp pilus assembly protein TadD
LICLEQALRDNDNPRLRLSLANLYHLENRPEDARSEYEKILAADGANSEAWFNLGVVHTMASRVAEAVEAYRMAVAHRPQYAEAWNNLGLLEHARRHAAEAESAYRQALLAKPSYRDALYNFALLLQQQDRMAEAAALYERLLSAHPDFAEAHNNLGNCYLKQNRVLEARSAYAEALARQAAHKEAPWNYGFASLLVEDYEAGWIGYEHRLAQAGVAGKNVTAGRLETIPRWTGELRPGARILVHHEQGLGDTLQFARYLAPMVRAGLRVDVLCQAPLAPLLARLPGLANCYSSETGLPDDWTAADWQAPFPSLPFHFATRAETIPAEVPYLAPSPERVREWRKAFACMPAGRTAGLVWQGNPKHSNDRHRSLPVHLLEGLTAIEGWHLVSLQKGAATVPRGVTDCGKLFRHFGDTAAAISQLDLVISVDTSVAHLAGAMGKPVWILLPFAPDWRWMLDRSDSPWYPSARLFRQTLPGDWRGVLASVREELAALP